MKQKENSVSNESLDQILVVTSYIVVWPNFVEMLKTIEMIQFFRLFTFCSFSRLSASILKCWWWWTCVSVIYRREKYKQKRVNWIARPNDRESSAELAVLSSYFLFHSYSLVDFFSVLLRNANVHITELKWTNVKEKREKKKKW